LIDIWQIDNINNSLPEKNSTKRRWISAEGICDECGQDHNYKPSFEGVRTSIDTFSELLRSKANIGPSVALFAAI
jgi:hypothetical protein